MKDNRYQNVKPAAKPRQYPNRDSQSPYNSLNRPVHDEAKEEHLKARPAMKDNRYQNVKPALPLIRVHGGSLSENPSRPKDIRSKTTVDRCMKLFMSQRDI